MHHSILLIIIMIAFFSCHPRIGDYVCKPCDLPCDKLTFRNAGTCPHCKMDLLRKSDLDPEVDLILNDVNIENGAGKFLLEGGFFKERAITVHYYKPTNLSSNSPVVLLVPGAGRNGDDYRDAWIGKAEEYNILVLSPEYSESNYPEFWSYNLAGMIIDIELNEERTAVEDFKLNREADEWIFSDFDRIFDLAKEALHLEVNSYDMFGHSAGGQILHRLSIFRPINKANRLLASNSGWYTVPTDEVDFPYGLRDSLILARDVRYDRNLILFLGEKDDANETRGSLRRTPEADLQGLHRLERGKYFYEVSKKAAFDLEKEFNWKLKIIPDVGHDFRSMGKAAADYLYKNKE